MTAYLLENNNLDHGQLLILVGVIWLKCELGLGVNLQLKHKDISGFTLWQKDAKLCLLSFWVMKRLFCFYCPFILCQVIRCKQFSHKLGILNFTICSSL